MLPHNRGIVVIMHIVYMQIIVRSAKNQFCGMCINYQHPKNVHCTMQKTGL